MLSRKVGLRVWFKTVGERNMTEFKLTKTLTKSKLIHYVSLENLFV